MKKILILIFLFSSLLGYSQIKLGNVWITGSGGQKIKFTGNNITTNNTIFYSTYFTKGNSSICDTNGNLILCSDGYNVYDSTANFIEEGDTLVNTDYYIHEDGWSLFSQSSIFLPMDSGKYYFITPSYSQGNLCYSCHFDILLYNVIDMNANGGAGKVVKRMQPLVTNTSLSRTQMMACRHSNGQDWWLLKQAGDSNKIYKFLFTQDSIYNYGMQKFNTPTWNTGWDVRGQSVFTLDGSRYATTVDGLSTGEVFIADFDRCYGGLTNPIVIAAPSASMHDPSDTTIKDRLSVGLAFSPNGKLLYVMCQYNIWQYDFEDMSWYHVAGLDTSWQEFQIYSASYLGPDNKLYIGNWSGLSKQMSVIDSPDVKGAGCNFCPRCLRMDTLVNGYAGTPPCMPNYSLGAQTCWPESSTQYAVDSKQLEVYPNPAGSVLYIKTESKEKRELYNSMGQLIFVTEKNEIDVRNYSTGVYYIKVKNVVEKIVIE